jgi:hypothetical protein
MTIRSRSHLQQGNDQIFYSLLGVVTVLGGLVAAIASMPDDPQPVGAVFWPALSLALGLLVVPILRVRRSIRSILRSEHILLLALIYWLLLDPLRSAYPLDLVSYDSVVTAIIAIGIMAIGIWIGAAGRGWRLPGSILRAARHSTNVSLFWSACTSFCLAMFYFAFSSGFDPSVMIDGLGMDRFGAPWSRGQSGGWAAFVEHMVYFGYILPSLTVLLAHRRGWLHYRVIISAVFSLIFIVFLAQSGGRRVIGVVIGAALVNWLLLQKRLRPRLLIVAIMTVAVMLAAMQAMLHYRNIGFEGWLRGDTPSETYSYLDVDDNFLRLAQTTDLFPQITPYVGLQPLVYLATRPIPRVFWPDKPADAGYDMAQLVNLMGSGGTSISHSIVGELYAMYGLLTVFLGGLFFGRLAAMWNKLLDLPRRVEAILIWGLGVMILFASIRSMQELLLMSYALIGWLIVARMLRWWKSRRLPLENDTVWPNRRVESQ